MSKIWIKIFNIQRYMFKSSLKLYQNLRNICKTNWGRGLGCIIFHYKPNLKKILTIYFIMWKSQKATFSSKIDPICYIMSKRRKVNLVLKIASIPIWNKILSRCFIMWKSMLYNVKTKSKVFITNQLLKAQNWLSEV